MILRAFAFSRGRKDALVSSVLHFPVPTIGSIIYVPTRLFIGHSEDDFIGGKATVKKVTTGISGGVTVHFIGVVERPVTLMNWEHDLARKQQELALHFGNHWSYRSPDYTNYEKKKTSW